LVHGWCKIVVRAGASVMRFPDLRHGFRPQGRVDLERGLDAAFRKRAELPPMRLRKSPAANAESRQPSFVASMTAAYQCQQGSTRTARRAGGACRPGGTGSMGTRARRLGGEGVKRQASQEAVDRRKKTGGDGRRPLLASPRVSRSPFAISRSAPLLFMLPADPTPTPGPCHQT
jgi:hypothetical protein